MRVDLLGAASNAKPRSRISFVSGLESAAPAVRSDGATSVEQPELPVSNLAALNRRSPDKPVIQLTPETLVCWAAPSDAFLLELRQRGQDVHLQSAGRRERVLAGLQRARNEGKRLGRPKGAVPIERVARVAHLPVRQAAKLLGVSRSTAQRWMAASQESLSIPA